VLKEQFTELLPPDTWSRTKCNKPDSPTNLRESWLEPSWGVSFSSE